MARSRWMWVGLLALWVVSFAGTAGAADRLEILANSYSYDFGRTLSFHFEASSPADIIDIRLTYGPVGESAGAITVKPAFTPGRHVILDFAHDLTVRRFQAFDQLEYYWVVSDARGQRLPSPPVRFEYADNRFQWQQLTEDGVTVAWHGGDRKIDFGRTALFDAQLARNKITTVTDSNLKPAFRVYIYSSAADLQTAAQVDRQEWIVGRAYPKTAICLVLIPEGVDFATELRRVVPHEISHLLIGDLATTMPRWLDEGLATDNEGVHDPQGQKALDEAASGGNLLQFEQLCSRFPADPRQAALAYAQSGSLVQYIRETRGHDALRRLVAAYQNAPDCENGLRSGLGVTLAQLQAEWENTLSRKADLGSTLRSGAPWLALCLGGGLIVLLALPSVNFRSGFRRPQRGATAPNISRESDSATGRAGESSSK